MNLINNLIIINQGQTPAKILFLICPLSVVVVINCIFSLFFVFFLFFSSVYVLCLFVLKLTWNSKQPNFKRSDYKKLDYFTDTVKPG